MIILTDDSGNTLTHAGFLRAARNMEQRGGSFAYSIGRAAQVADVQNSQRLFRAFSDLFLHYAQPHWDPVHVDVA